MFSFAHDDMASFRPIPPKNPPKIKEKVVAVIPVHGRHPLLKQTISRLLNKNGCHAVVCAGDREDKDVCEQAGATYIIHDNRFLGQKWNACFLRAERMNPDAVLFMGSSDWVSDNWVPTMLSHLNSRTHMVGKSGCYLLDISDPYYPSYSEWYRPKPIREYRLVYWPGYKYGSPIDSTQNRSNESIGIGRLISKKGLDNIGWKPFHDKMHDSLDYCMHKKFRDHSKIVYDKSICSMAVSTDRWSNKHTFEHHWDNTNPSKRIRDVHGFCRQHFPEYDKIF